VSFLLSVFAFIITQNEWTWKWTEEGGVDIVAVVANHSPLPYDCFDTGSEENIVQINWENISKIWFIRLVALGGNVGNDAGITEKDGLGL
jgi:hypothetical protein